MHSRQARMMVGMLLLGTAIFASREAKAADPASGTPEDRPTTGTPAGSPAPSLKIGNELQPVPAPRGGLVDLERDPGLGPLAHEPIFIGPTATTERTRSGISSWITPGAPFEHREDPGGVAVGFTISWPAPKPDVASSGQSAWRGSAGR
jgi:hypothetical protein